MIYYQGLNQHHSSMKNKNFEHIYLYIRILFPFEINQTVLNKTNFK